MAAFDYEDFLRECAGDEKIARAVVTKIHSIIDRIGFKAYGNIFADGDRVKTAANFSTDRKKDDTHKILCILWDEVGRSSYNRPPDIDLNDEDEMSSVNEQRALVAEARAKQLQDKLNGRI